MLFNSMQFCIYFPLVAGLYFVIPRRWQWCFLLVASYGFYMAWEPGYVVLLWLSTLVDYGAALGMAQSDQPAIRRRWLALSLGTNLGLLFFFKYYNFFRDSLGAGVEALGWSLELPHSAFLLPLGISFYTFQTLSYTVDVYRGTLTPERHLGRFALYVCFFPQLVAGPIERAARLLPQLHRTHGFDYERVASGLRLMGWGLFKKMVIADRLAMAVEFVYRDPSQHGGPVLVLATLCFAYQIYCDFSGYSDIAIGAARVLGVRLSTNFNRPYAAPSIGEFWRRWHITLSTWFRDYVYVPLGGSRLGHGRWIFSIMVVFAVSGLWHGANWTFLLWGLLHGSYLLVERGMTAKFPALSALPTACKIALTFAATNFAWIFFRATDPGQAWAIVGRLGSGWGAALHPAYWSEPHARIGLWRDELLFVIAAIVVMEVVQYFHARTPLQPWFRSRPLWLRWTAYSLLFWTIFLGGIFRQTAFYYFVF